MKQQLTKTGYQKARHQPKTPLHMIAKLSSYALEQFQKTSFGGSLLEANDDVFFMVCEKSGQVWVSTPGNMRVHLEQFRIFERYFEHSSFQNCESDD